MAGDVVEVVIKDTNLLFRTAGLGLITSVEGLRIDKSGVLKEFPDLEDNNEWRKIALERLKEKVKTIDGEMNRLYYVKDELTKFGWKPLFYQPAGFRQKKF